MTTTRPNAAMVIVNWDGWRNTFACLDSLAGSMYPNGMISSFNILTPAVQQAFGTTGTVGPKTQQEAVDGPA